MKDQWTPEHWPVRMCTACTALFDADRPMKQTDCEMACCPRTTEEITSMEQLVNMRRLIHLRAVRALHPTEAATPQPALAPDWGKRPHPQPIPAPAS